MDNPYETPKVQEVDDEKNVKGGFFTSEDAMAVECLGAWISLNKRYLRVKYLPQKSRKIVLIIFCIAVVLLIPFASIGALEALILFAIINTIIRVKDSSKIEFLLDEENLLIDRAKRTIGIRKEKNGKTILIGTKVPYEIQERLVRSEPNPRIFRGSMMGLFQREDCWCEDASESES